MVQALQAGEIDAVMLDPAQAGQLRGQGYSVLLDMFPVNCLPAAALRMVRRASTIRPCLPITLPTSMGPP